MPGLPEDVGKGEEVWVPLNDFKLKGEEAMNLSFLSLCLPVCCDMCLMNEWTLYVCVYM